MINKKNIAQQAADHIADQIIAGHLSGGQRLGEQDWAARLEVSRSSIREALIILQRHHLVELSAGKGARVAPLDERWLNEVYQLWYLLFEAAAVAFAEQGDQAGVDQLRTKADELAELAEAKQRQHFFDQALDLATALARLAGRPLLMEHLLTLLPAAKRCYRVVLWQDQAETGRTLFLAAELLAAVEKGDIETLRRLIRDYAGWQVQSLRIALAQTATD